MGDTGGMIGYMAWAYLVPVCIHGAYDYAIMAASYGLLAEGWTYVILLGAYIAATVLILVCSNHDHRIDGRPETADYGFYRTEYRRPGRSYYYQSQPGNPMEYPINSGYPGNASYPNGQSYMGNIPYPPGQGYPGNNAYSQNQYDPGNVGVNPYRSPEAAGEQMPDTTVSYDPYWTYEQSASGYNGQGDDGYTR